MSNAIRNTTSEMALVRDDFHVVLPSNSSMGFYPNNTTTHFTTQLSRPLTLMGEWAVSLEEINIPMTLLHIPPDENHITLSTSPITSDILSKFPKQNNDTITINAMRTHNYTEEGKEFINIAQCGVFPRGIYQNIMKFIEALNNTPVFKDHLHCDITPGGYVFIERICAENCSLAITEETKVSPLLLREHHLLLAPRIQKILGLPPSNTAVLVQNKNARYMGIRPACLHSVIPDSIFVYTDICENYITGDVQSPLLRVVPLHIDHHYQYGSSTIRCFSPQRYIPLLRKNFMTIEMDIRDEYGQPILFEGGTLTVTLHFKRIA